GANALHNIYPIRNFDSSTHGNMGRPYPGKLPATGGPYIIGQCAINGVNQVANNGTSMSITGLVLRSNSFPWTAGHTVENTISPYSAIQHGLQVAWTHYGPLAKQPNMIEITNLGYQTAASGLGISSAPYFDGVTKGAYHVGFGLDDPATTEIGNLRLSSRDVGGLGIFLKSYAAPNDYHQ